jgi:hypothetical protein
MAWAEVSAEADMEDKKEEKGIVGCLVAVVVRKNTNQWRETNENIGLW